MWGKEQDEAKSEQRVREKEVESRDMGMGIEAYG